MGFTGRLLNVSLIQHEVAGTFVVRYQPRSFWGQSDFCVKLPGDINKVPLLELAPDADPAKVAAKGVPSQDTPEEAGSARLADAERLARDCVGSEGSKLVGIVVKAKDQFGLGKVRVEGLLATAVEMHVLTTSKVGNATIYHRVAKGLKDCQRRAESAVNQPI